MEVNKMGTKEKKQKKGVGEFEIMLDRDIFTRRLIRELTNVLQDLVGMEQAKGYISLVGTKIGKIIEDLYKRSLDVKILTIEDIVEILVDLKKRIGGKFYIISHTPDKIVLGNKQCPFEEDVKGCPSLCMMTSNVFGGIVSRNSGFAKVCLQATIAQRDPECRVIIYLQNTKEALSAEGVEYLREEEITL